MFLLITICSPMQNWEYHSISADGYHSILAVEMVFKYLNRHWPVNKKEEPLVCQNRFAGQRQERLGKREMLRAWAISYPLWKYFSILTNVTKQLSSGCAEALGISLFLSGNWMLFYSPSVSKSSWRKIQCQSKIFLNHCMSRCMSIFFNEFFIKLGELLKFASSSICLGHRNFSLLFNYCLPLLTFYGAL